MVSKNIDQKRNKKIDQLKKYFEDFKIQLDIPLSNPTYLVLL